MGRSPQDLNGMILRSSEAVCGEILDRCAPLSLRPVERPPWCLAAAGASADTIGMSGEVVETETPYQIISNHQESESQFDDSMTVASILVSLAVLHAISFSMTAMQVGRRGLPCGCHTGCLSSTLGPWG